MQEEKIETMKKSHFKKVVKEKIAVEAFNFLMKKKETHSKLDNIHYDKLQIQSFLKSNSGLDNHKKYLLIKLRTRMTDMKNNYKNKLKILHVTFARKKLINKVICSIVRS